MLRVLVRPASLFSPSLSRLTFFSKQSSRHRDDLQNV